DPAVRARLEAALDFWTREQSEDGRFSEYAPERWSLAPTAFATKFMGETLRLLHHGPPIDPALYRRVVEADRRAIVAALTLPDLAGEFIEPLRRWYEWLGYNAVPEPGESALTLNRAIETRQRRSVVAEAGPGEAETGNPLSAELVAARILGPTQEELLRRHAQQRTELARHWPHVEPLAAGTFRAFSPYAFPPRR